MRTRALVPIFLVALAAPAAAAPFLAIPPLVAPAPRASHVHARQVSCWEGGVLVSGHRMLRDDTQRSGTRSASWLAEVHGPAVRELAWPPPYLNVPDPDGIRLCGAVGARVAVVAEGQRDRRRVSRLLLWDGRDWEMLPPVTGTIHSVVEHEGRLVIGGDFPVNETTALHVLSLSDGEWLPFGGGLPLPRTSVEVLPWQDTLVAVGDPWDRATNNVRCLWLWRHGQWSPLGPEFRSSMGLMVKAVVWNDRLVVGGTFTALDGAPSAGLFILDADGTLVEPEASAGRHRSALPLVIPAGVWDGRLVLRPLQPWARSVSLLLLAGAELTPMPRLPTGQPMMYAQGDISIRGREMAVLAFGDFTGAGIPDDGVFGRRQLAFWRDGSWWVPSLEGLEEQGPARNAGRAAREARRLGS